MHTARFPASSGEALDGTPFEAPRDLAGTRTVAAFGFSLEHRGALESWVPFFDPLARSGAARVRLFLPLKVPKLLRGGIVAAMKKAVTEPELRASTIPLFQDVDVLCEALGIAGREHLVVLLLEPDGRVAWHGAGPFTDAAGASLSAALRG
ncbi:MAG: hypothetical protein NVS3B7_07460 [Candidatus Elarobacter sp.]